MCIGFYISVRARKFSEISPKFQFHQVLPEVPLQSEKITKFQYLLSLKIKGQHGLFLLQNFLTLCAPSQRKQFESKMQIFFSIKEAIFATRTHRMGWILIFKPARRCFQDEC